eukprot:9243473-Lingulodinium_polyedra.AAC.1
MQYFMTLTVDSGLMNDYRFTDQNLADAPEPSPVATATVAALPEGHPGHQALNQLRRLCPRSPSFAAGSSTD